MPRPGGMHALPNLGKQVLQESILRLGHMGGFGGSKYVKSIPTFHP